ncbi:MAG: TonB-dependent receptor plug domain-containing protein [Bacteroidales bacterium]|nr:TonB-dependent receptor plug domain-containing protein [Bacteroidales bacterium]
MKRITLFLFFFLTFSFGLSAQNTNQRNLYLKAENDYKDGRIESALVILEDSLRYAEPPLSGEVYRLCGLCYLALDKEEKTEEYAELLLEANPYYSSIDDPLRFTDILEKIRFEAKATVSAASFQSETIDEVPVPVTLITRQMIKDCGAQTLQDVLIAYVPSVTTIQYNGQMNFAMRGLYGQTQENVLIMMDGIRLNSYGFNTGIADYSVSLDKIKQIEVLRGPGSSLYGDVALSAVVNIVTKSGSDINGLELSASVGNCGQRRASLVGGKNYGKFDLTVWTNAYYADGEEIDFSTLRKYTSDTLSGKYTVGAYNQKPVYDLGFRTAWKDLSFTFRHSASKSVHILSDKNQPYDYNRYAKMDALAPGDYIPSFSADLAYNKKIGKFTVSASAHFFAEKPEKYQVTADTTTDSGVVYYDYYYEEEEYDEEGYEYEEEYDGEGYYQEDDEGYEDEYQEGEYTGMYYVLKEYYSGLAKYTMWQTSDYKASLRAIYNYGEAKRGGTILFGVDYNYLNATDFYQTNIAKYDYKIQNRYYYNNKKYFTGDESANDFYVQFKHCFGRFIINSGARFDYRQHKLDTNDIHVLSPRISFIYMLDKLNFKLGFSKSYVDVPYAKRYNNITLYSLSEKLDPENLSSVQFTVSGKNFVKNLNTEVNFFYNRCIGLLNLAFGNLLMNSDVNTLGAEFSADYKQNKLFVNANMSFIHSSSDVKTYIEEEVSNVAMKYTYNGNVFNVPSFSGNVTAAYQALKKLRFSLNCKFLGQQYTKYFDDMDNEWMAEKLPAVTLFSPGAVFNHKNLEISLFANNVFNKKYYQGGGAEFPIRQKGCWFLLGIKGKFKNL